MLKTLLLHAKVTAAQNEMAELEKAGATLEARSADLENAIRELGEKTDATEEERSAVENAVTEFENDKAAHETRKTELEQKISDLTAELEAEEARQTEAAKAKEPAKEPEKREDDKIMNTREFFGMSHEQRDAFIARNDVKEFLQRVRDMAASKRAVTGGDLFIPTVMLDIMRETVERQSKLLPYVRYLRVAGKGRQPVAGRIPEAVWTEACGALNQMDIVFNAEDIDAYKIGAYIPICNALLEDSDIDLASEILTALATGIAQGVDNAILFGTGVKMPLGIVTRLAQTAQPDSWGTNAPAWTDLHTSNVLSLNIDSTTGTEFFAALMAALGVAKPTYSNAGLFWVMNRKTHMKLLGKALAFNQGGALVAGMNSVMPVIGGTIIEMEDERINDNCIIGGFGGNYLLGERKAATFARSEEYLFVEDMTVFKGTARFDGKPIAGEAFVSVNFANSGAQTTHTFPTDYANTDLTMLTVTAAAGASAGDTVLTVTGAVNNPATLRYKVKGNVNAISAGDKVTGWTALTSGTTQITATAGTVIGVVELDSTGRVISAGSVKSVPKT